MDFFVSRVALRQLSVSAFLYAAMIPAYHHANVFILVKDVETLRHNWLVPRCIELCTGYLSRVVEVLRGKDCYLLHEQRFWHVFLQTEKRRDYALHFCSSAWLGRCIPSFKEDFHATRGSSHVPYGQFSISFASMNPPFEVKRPSVQKKHRPLCNHFVNASVVTEDERSIDVDIARYISTTRLRQDFLEEDEALVWVS